MSKNEKLLDRLLSNPKDFTWEELVNLLRRLGYNEYTKKGKAGGSRRKFTDLDKNIISIHKPHPGNIVKEYALKDVIKHLTEKGKI